METETIVIDNSQSVPVQLTKVVLCAIAGFLAGKGTEKVFDASLAKFRNR